MVQTLLIYNIYGLYTKYIFCISTYQIYIEANTIINIIFGYNVTRYLSGNKFAGKTDGQNDVLTKQDCYS